MIDWKPWRFDRGVELGMYVQIVATNEVTDETRSAEGFVIHHENDKVKLSPDSFANAEETWFAKKWREGILRDPPKRQIRGSSTRITGALGRTKVNA